MNVEITHMPPSHWAVSANRWAQSWLVEVRGGPEEISRHWVSSNEILSAGESVAELAKKYCGDWTFSPVEMIDHLKCGRAAGDPAV
jgi:hypothetical protein